ncbi:methyltransferase domain-containing protein [Patescibacteria group bacterium]|nr:methyltransferase domain-containing protein [Patescibacteria group bacterium]
MHGFLYYLIGQFAIRAEGGLHPKHRLMQYHDFFVDNIVPGASVLDIGCGNGALAYDLAGKAGQVTGIDINYKNQSHWQYQYQAPNLHYLVGDATSYPFAEQFDYVVLSNVLEHIENRVEFLNKIKNLAPTLLIRVPMINRDWVTLYKKDLGLPYTLDDTHCIEYTFEGFTDELRLAGLRVESYSIQFGEIWAVVKSK